MASVDQQSWVNIGPLLQSACDEMDLGQLVHGQAFSLFEAMSAVEVGCVKMDAGATKAKSLDELIKEGKAPTTLSSAQLLAVMDQLMVLEATWQKGASLAQTVYSCLYMLKSDRIEGLLPLSAYCKGLKATCLEIRALMMQADVCEDEDVSLNTFGLPLEDGATSTATDKCLGTLSLAIDQVNNMQKQHAATSQGASPPSSSSDPPTSNNNSSPDADSVSIDPAHYAAVLARLMFRKHLLQAIRRMLKKGKEDLEAARKLLVLCLQFLETIRATASLVEGVEAVGFDSKVNFHLLAPAPPRPFEMLSKDKAWQFFQGLLQELITACSITSVTNLQELNSFLESYTRPGPCPLARCLLHIQLAQKSWEGTTPPPWAPSRAMLSASIGIPAEPTGIEDLEMFVEQAMIGATNWVQGCLLNKARRRRRLRRCCEDWGSIHTHAVVADEGQEVAGWMAKAGWNWKPLNVGDEQGPLGTWVEVEGCRTAVNHLLMGFEMEVYLTNEYCMIYWYCDYLISLMLDNLRHLHATRPPPAPPAPPAPKGSGGKPLKQRAKDVRAAAEAKALAAHNYNLAVKGELMYLDMQRFLCVGLVRLLAALDVAGVLPVQRQWAFNNEEQHFEQRFASLAVMARPPLLTFSQYQVSTDCTAVSANHLLMIAQQMLKQVRSTALAIHQSPDLKLSSYQLEVVKQLERLALQNMVACAVLGKALDAGSSLQASFDFSVHPYFPALVLKGTAGGSGGAAGGSKQADADGAGSGSVKQAGSNNIGTKGS